MKNYISIPTDFDPLISDEEIAKHKNTIPLGTQEFPVIIQTKSIYVDKTPYISSWILNGVGKTNLLHRPRRFGKTLTLSVIKEIYSHNKILFKGTQLTPKFWKAVQPRPVISLSLAVRNELNPVETLDSAIARTLKKHMRKLGIFYKKDEKIPTTELLSEIVSRLSDKGPEFHPVILIDEYDSLLTYAYESGTSMQEAAQVIGTYLNPLKYSGLDIYASYMIGIMKYQGLKLMSSVNNPSDQTFSAAYALMVGFTMEEIQRYFMPEITRLSRILKMRIEEVLQKIKINYNGYSFSPDNLEKTVYAGYSFCNFISDATGFWDYWYSTGGINTIYSRSSKDLNEIRMLLDQGQIATSMSVLKIGHKTESGGAIALTTLLFYHGYLTFKNLPKQDEILLHFPNDEVKRAFSRSYLEHVFKIKPFVLERNLRQLDRYIKKFQIKELIVFFSQQIAGIPASMHTPAEKNYQMIIFIYLETLYGSAVRGEQPLAGGTPDLVLELRDLVYIFEFKYVAKHASNAPLITALKNASEQVISKRYFETYARTPRLLSMGIVVSGIANNIVGYQVIQNISAEKLARSKYTPDKPVFLPPEEIAQQAMAQAAEKLEDLKNLKNCDYSPVAILPASSKNDENEKLKDEIIQLQESQEKQELKLLLAEAQKNEALALSEKAEAKALEIEAKARNDQITLILRLKAKGESSQSICELLNIS